MRGQIKDAVKITFFCEFLHGHTSGAVGMKCDHLVSLLFQSVFGCLSTLGDKSEKGQGNPFFLFLRLPVALNHAADTGGGFIQDAARNTVHTQ